MANRTRLAGLWAVLALAASLVPAASGEDRATRTAIGVRNGDSEFSFYLSRTEVKPGPAFIEYTNTGEDPHDLWLKRAGSKRKRNSESVAPGERASFELRLRARSRYRLWCSLEGHREAGMKARIRVTRRI